MPFDPNFPPFNAELISADFRDQFNALKALSDGLQAALNQMQAQMADLQNQVANIPAGPQGPQGADGAQGPQGPEGVPGPTAVLVEQNDPGGAQGTIWIRPSDGNVAVRVGAGWDNRGSMKGQQGDPGAQGDPGPEGPQGDPGEVTTQQMNDAIGAAIAGTANSLNGVATLNETHADPVIQAVIDKLNETISSGHR